MKKILLLSAVAALFLFSCKKEHSSSSTSPTGKKYQVTFNVSNFMHQQGDFSLKGNDLSLKQHNLADSVVNVNGYLDVLYYYVFDRSMAGEPTVHMITQDSTLSDQFGIITDSLPTGHYTIAIVAGKKGLLSENGADILHTFATYGGFNWQDTFFYLAQIDVPATPSSYNVTLHRQVAKLELQLLDSIPPAAKTIKIGVLYEFSALNFQDQTIDGGDSDTGFTFKTIPVSAIGKPNFTVDRIQGATAFSTNVYVTCFDASNHVIAHTTVTGVTFKPNTKTILSGKLFGNSTGGNSQSFQVKVDTAWSSTVNQLGFSLRRH